MAHKSTGTKIPKEMRMPSKGQKIRTKSSKVHGAKDVATKARIVTQDSELKPHEWLNQVMNGAGVVQTFIDMASGEERTETVYPSVELRQDSAKAAAQYYAPKLVAQKIDAKVRTFENLSDEELDAELARELHG